MKRILLLSILAAGSAFAQCGSSGVLIFNPISSQWDCTAVAGAGLGSVTSVAESFTGGLISVSGSPVTTSGTLALTVAGTSGGVPYFSGAATWASSGALTANLPVIGGGAGQPPAVGTRSGSTTKYVTTTGTLTSGDCVKIDASGNFIAQGSACGSGTGTVTVVGGGALTSTALVTGGGTTTLQTPAATATLDSSGNIVLPAAATLTAPGGVSTGTAPPSLTAGTGGVDAYGEGTVPSVCAGASIDCLYADSTSHTLKASFNNGAYYSLARTIASGSKALATGAISSAACTSAQTDTATGTLTTDVVSATFNGDPTGVTGYVPLTSGMLTIIVYPSADTVNVKVCNNTSSSITPGAITLNWRVTR